MTLNDRIAAQSITARCGRTDAHGGHVFPAGVGPDGRTDGTVRDAFCAGNVGTVIVGIPQSPFTRRALAGILPAKDRTAY